MNEPKSHEIASEKNIKGKTIYWRWKSEEGAVNESQVIDDLEEILILKGTYPSRINVPRKEIKIFKVV